MIYMLYAKMTAYMYLVHMLMLNYSKPYSIRRYLSDSNDHISYNIHKSTFRGTAVLSALYEAGDGFAATRRLAFVYKHS
jgi:uncharacterized protein (UPF0147 family)